MRWSTSYVRTIAGDRLVALGGVAAPNAGGAAYAAFSNVSIDSTGNVAFVASLSSGTVGVFVSSGPSVRAIALAGDVAPGTGGTTYTAANGSSIGANGGVAFLGTLSSGTTGSFVDSGGTVRAVALLGDPAPGSGGGNYIGSSGFPSAGASGEVAFAAGVVGGTTTRGVFADRGGADTVVAVAGDPAPGTGGGTLAGLSSPSIAANGEVAFFATMTGGHAASGLFVGPSRPNAVPAMGPAGLLTLSGLLAGAALAVLQRSSRNRGEQVAVAESSIRDVRLASARGSNGALVSRLPLSLSTVGRMRHIRSLHDA